MPLYQILTAAGDVVRESTVQNDVVAAGLREGETLHVIADLDAVPDRNLKAWDSVAKAYVDRVDENAAPRVVTTMSVLDFKARFTDTERLRIDLAEIAHPDLTTRALLKRVREDLSDCKDKVCDRADPRIQRGVAFLTTVTYDGAPLLTQPRMLAIIGADAFNPANLA
ncbi:MAG: hypothetical protein K2R93_12460 [Gemmatimonadaceae bacterium]|nr:hypothetical protein [Gemmatimonadaceae bacterium]